MDISSILITLVILLFSVVIHELCHGLAADRLGDTTARWAGRLTLNPIPHLDLFGSFLLPLFLFLVNSPVILGAAKPVPVNFANLRSPKRDMALVSLAGPAANFAIALIFALPIRFGFVDTASGVYGIMLQVVMMNLVLGTFNLIPIPPLDGSKVLASLLSDDMMYRILSLERYGFILIILFLSLGLLDRILVPALRILSQLFIGTAAI